MDLNRSINYFYRSFSMVDLHIFQIFDYKPLEAHLVMVTNHNSSITNCNKLPEGFMLRCHVEISQAAKGFDELAVFADRWASEPTWEAGNSA